MKFQLLILTLSFYSQILLSQDFDAKGPGNTKYQRISHIEKFLEEENKRKEDLSNALIAQEKVIEELQKKINELVYKHVLLDAENEIKKKENLNSELLERVSVLEEKVKELNLGYVKDLKEKLDEFDTSIKVLQELMKTKANKQSN